MSLQNWWKYTIGYKEAGDLLLRNALEGGRQHVLVFPIIFLYRHYIELILKEIIMNNRAFLGISENFPNYHNIDRLWEICRENFQKVDEAIDPQFTKSEEYQKIVEGYNVLEIDLRKFAVLDPTSESFRYPVDNRGRPIVVDKKIVNLKELPELINRISEALEGISVGAYEILKQKEDGMHCYD